MNKNTLVFGLLGLGLLAFLFTRKRDAGARTTFGTTATASPPGFFGLGGFQVPAISIPAKGSSADVYASAIGSAVNSFGALAKQIWKPNTEVATRGAGRSDSPREALPVPATSYQLNNPDYVPSDFNYPSYGEPGSEPAAGDDLYDYGDSFGI